MPVTPEVAHHRARIANATMRSDHLEAAAARRDMGAALLNEKAEMIVAAAPPLTDDQIERLRDILRPLVLGS